MPPPADYAASMPPHRLLAEPLTAAAFALYGSVVEAPVARGVAINGASSERFELGDCPALQPTAAGRCWRCSGPGRTPFRGGFSPWRC